ncbi:MAG TPA: type II toxin-antitoxin system VapC family toxin [Actinomycetota bacterium]|nr:type II toxin-antitoxin system VapC family toxin [Actinomycetota bacterium]
MIVLDTTVLVYAVGDDHELREPGRRLVEALGDGRVQATTTAEVIQEFVHVRARRRDRRDAARLGEAFAELLSPLLTVDRDDLRAGLELFRRNARLGAFDAVLAAAALERDAAALVSADAAFGSVRDLPFVHLGSSGLARLTGE